jgi:hypothetical protein
MRKTRPRKPLDGKTDGDGRGAIARTPESAHRALLPGAKICDVSEADATLRDASWRPPGRRRMENGAASVRRKVADRIEATTPIPSEMSTPDGRAAPGIAERIEGWPPALKEATRLGFRVNPYRTTKER